MNPRTITYGTKEYRNLEAIAKMLEAVSPNKATYEVEEVYFDLGQNWLWTTICRIGYMDCQILNPREWNEILNSKTIQDLADIADEIRNDKYFLDN